MSYFSQAEINVLLQEITAAEPDIVTMFAVAILQQEADKFSAVYTGDKPNTTQHQTLPTTATIVTHAHVEIESVLTKLQQVVQHRISTPTTYSDIKFKQSVLITVESSVQ